MKIKSEDSSSSEAPTAAFEYTPPPFFASDSRVPCWVQARIADVYIFVTMHYNLWMVPFLLAFAVMYQVRFDSSRVGVVFATLGRICVI